MSVKIDEAYETVMGYVPEDAREVLARQIPRIQKTIDDELTQFSKELSDYIEVETRKMLREVAQQSQQWRATIEQQLEELETMTNADLASLQASVQSLRENLDRYENTWKSLGTNTRRLVIAAARGAGIPVPDIAELEIGSADPSGHV